MIVHKIPEQAPRSLAFLLDLYLSKLPLFAFEKDVLYCHPRKCSNSSVSWYEGAPVGKNKLVVWLRRFVQKLVLMA